MGDESPHTMSKQDHDMLLTTLVEEYECCVCHEIMVLPTTLVCGHSFCRHCLSKWVDLGKTRECPECRQTFNGYPKVNIQMKSSMLKLFSTRYQTREREILDDPTLQKYISEFDEILKKKDDDEEMSGIISGVVIGVGICLIALCFYMAFHWSSSDMDLLVNKPLLKWSVDDVAYWINDIGLDSYTDEFVTRKVNGRILSEITAHDLQATFNMNNDLHQRTFLNALNYTKITGVKLPSNLWEYKSLYSGYTTFLLYSMGHTPRLALTYLYRYDNESFSFFLTAVSDYQIPTSMGSEPGLFLLLGCFLFPYVACIRFVACFSDIHYWTSRIVIIQCVCKCALEVAGICSWLKRPSISVVGNLLGESTLMIFVYYAARLVWWLVPHILIDAFFYLELYFSAVFYLKEFFSHFYN